jgi:dipeptidyl aminopeptidase/acylaminoacyl peptidase
MTEPLSAETLVYDFQRAGDPRISPDGTKVVYTISKADGRHGDHAAVVVRRRRRRPAAAHPRWPDEPWRAMVTGRLPHRLRLGSGGRCGIFVMALAGGDSRQVARHRQTVSDLAWSPDGTTLAYVTDFDPDDPEEDTRRPPDRCESRTASTTRPTASASGVTDEARLRRRCRDGHQQAADGRLQDYASPVWSPAGTVVAAQRSAPDGDGSRLALIEVESGSMSLVGPEGVVVDQWAWSPDGRRADAGCRPGHSHQSDICVLDVASGEMRTVVEDPDWTPGGKPGIGMLAPPVWLDADNVLIQGVHRGGNGGVHDRRVQRRGPPDPSSESMPGVLTVDAGGRLAVREFTSLRPGARSKWSTSLLVWRG